MKRIHVGISQAQIKSLDKLAAELGMDRSNAIRYCIAVGTGYTPPAERQGGGIKKVN